MSFFTQRDDTDLGGAQERAMFESVGGADTIRTTEWQNDDGTWSRLSTRNGWPIFETDKLRTSTGSTSSVRGFVAKVPGGTAVLFDPYTLTVLQSPYTPALNTYTVQDFATSWNVPSGDTTHWCDVMLFDGTRIKVNGASMSSLGITVDHGFPAIPYVINRVDASDRYGNAERNTSEKRVFAIGRYSVKSWGGGGTAETLTPTAPRTENRCLTIGQRTDRATHTARLGQLYHGAEGWDGATEWYFSGASVQMLLTSTYLVKSSLGANVAMPLASLMSAGLSSGSMSTDVTLPSTEVALMAHGVVGSTNPFVPNTYSAPGYGGNYSCRFEFNAIASRELSGKVDATYSRVTYDGSSTSTVEVAGVVLSYVAKNNKKWDVRDESTSIKAQSVVLFVMDESGVSNSNGSDMTANSSALYWGQHFTTPLTDGLNASGPGPNRGTPNKNISGESISSSSVTRNYEEQTCSFSVSADSGALVSGSFSRSKSSGPEVVFTANPSTYYHAVVDTYSWPGPTFSGLGIYNGPVNFQAYTSSATDETWLYRYHGVYYSPFDWYVQPQEAVDAINAKYSGMRAQFQAQTCYDSENSDGYSTSSARGGPYYTATVSPSVTLDNCLLNWSTKDYLLYDATNGVFISVESTFAGVDALATLSVLLRVKTRHHDTTQVLGTYAYNYGSPEGMLPEREIESTGKYAVPSPQIRAIFAPLYQEQGSFKGAHYVTSAEESGGAVPFHGFNFLLHLSSYASFDTCNADNDGQAVYFVPCNLLEMLYAFVFSSELGVALTGERYPVTYPARFTALMSTLFSNPFRVSVLNGSVVNWTDSFGVEFSTVSTVSLHRV